MARLRFWWPRLVPGAMNGINVVANALQDRVPMIVLTGCVDADEALTYTHQVMDHAQVYRSITKGSVYVDGRWGRYHRRQGGIAGQPSPAPARYTSMCRSRWPIRAYQGLNVVDWQKLPPVAPGAECLEKARRWVAEAERPHGDHRS